MTGSGVTHRFSASGKMVGYGCAEPTYALNVL
jgi:hypothetical protein